MPTDDRYATDDIFARSGRPSTSIDDTGDMKKEI